MNIYNLLSSSYKNNVNTWFKSGFFIMLDKNKLDWVVNQSKNIIKYINTKKNMGTIRNNLLTISKIYKLKDIDNEFIKNLREKSDDIKNKMLNSQKNQVLKKQVINNYVDWITILKKRSQLRRLFMKNKNNKQLNLKLMILGLYSYIKPLRADFINVPIVNTKPTGNELTNILYNDNGKYTFYLNKDKVVRSMGKQIYKFPSPLNKLIKLSVDSYQRSYLLPSLRDKDNPMNINVFLNLLGDIMKNENKRLSVRILRSSYITYYNDKKKRSLNQLEKIAKQMRHSAGIANLNYNKILTDDQIKNSIIVRLKKENL